MTTLQTEYSAAELLANKEVVEPLIVRGHRCHGGFDAEGNYVPPRTKHRLRAITAWEQQRVEQFSTPILDVPLDTWPENFPNVEQSRLLITRGVPEPIITALTRIGTVEGFGAMLRLLPTPDFSRCFEEDITGTAIAHIDNGLFEAHARDEAGFGDIAGHNRMWFLARDIAFENPQTDDLTSRMLNRMGIDPTPNSDAKIQPPGYTGSVARVLPNTIDLTLESLVDLMINLLLIEISAFHNFQWAEEMLGDIDLVAGNGEASALISCIRTDEEPHVAWLRTALSEMRDRTWIGSDGGHYPGTQMIGLLWEKALGESIAMKRRENINLFMDQVERSVAGRPDSAEIVDEMLSLGSVVRLDDGSVADLGPAEPPD